MIFYRLDAKGGGDMGLAGARIADQDHVLPAVHEFAVRQGPDGGLVDLAGRGVEVGEVLAGREACGLPVMGVGPDFAFGQVGLQPLRQDRDGGFGSWSRLLEEIISGLRHAIHFQAALQDDDGSGGGGQDAWRP